MESVIAIKELCEALGVEYDTSKSSAYYLHMVKEYRFHYEASQHRVQWMYALRALAKVSK